MLIAGLIFGTAPTAPQITFAQAAHDEGYDTSIKWVFVDSCG